jgi:hypothetical protein
MIKSYELGVIRVTSFHGFGIFRCVTHFCFLDNCQQGSKDNRRDDILLKDVALLRSSGKRPDFNQPTPTPFP